MYGKRVLLLGGCACFVHAVRAMPAMPACASSLLTCVRFAVLRRGGACVTLGGVWLDPPATMGVAYAHELTCLNVTNPKKKKDHRTSSTLGLAVAPCRALPRFLTRTRQTSCLRVICVQQLLDTVCILLPLASVAPCSGSPKRMYRSNGLYVVEGLAELDEVLANKL